jgi:hypothetical protein
VFTTDGTAVIARRFAVLSPHIELYESKSGPIIAFVTREPIKDGKGNMWRVLFAQYSMMRGKQIMIGYEPSVDIVASSAYFSLICPNKQLRMCIHDLIDRIVQKRLPERLEIRLEPDYVLTIDTSPAQIAHMYKTLILETNYMKNVFLAELQYLFHDVENFKTFNRLLFKRDINRLRLVDIIIKISIGLMKLFSLLSGIQHTEVEEKKGLLEVAPGFEVVIVVLYGVAQCIV